LDLGFYYGGVVSEVGLSIFGHGHHALGPNRKSQMFDWNFHSKQDYNVSLWSLWLAVSCFWFKSCGTKAIFW